MPVWARFPPRLGGVRQGECHEMSDWSNPVGLRQFLGSSDFGVGTLGQDQGAHLLLSKGHQGRALNSQRQPLGPAPPTTGVRITRMTGSQPDDCTPAVHRRQRHVPTTPRISLFCCGAGPGRGAVRPRWEDACRRSHGIVPTAAPSGVPNTRPRTIKALRPRVLISHAHRINPVIRVIRTPDVGGAGPSGCRCSPEVGPARAAVSASSVLVLGVLRQQ